MVQFTTQEGYSGKISKAQGPPLGFEKQKGIWLNFIRAINKI